MLRGIVGAMLLMLACPVSAEIYKCRDAEGKVIYQGTPCAQTTLGRVQPPPPVSEQDRQRAREDLERLQRANREFAAEREKEWQRQEEARLRAEEQERLRQQAERERLEAEARTPLYWYPWHQHYPAYHGHPRPGHGKGETVRQKQEGIHCIPTYVGGRSCQ